MGSGKRHGLLADVARQGEVEPAVAGDDSGGEQGKVAVAGEDGNGGRSDCGGDFIKQFLTAFGRPLFLFWPRGTALTWEVTSSLPSL